MLSKNKIKYIQSLGQKKFRDQEQLFIAEGPKIIAELMEPGLLKIRELFATNEWMQNNEKKLKGIPCNLIDETELERISKLATPHQVLALVEMPRNETLPDAKGQIILAIEDIRDPGNLGTIVRIADWFGVAAVICSHDTTELFNPKTIQSAMGSVNHIPVFYTELAEWIFAQKESPVYAAVLNGEDVTSMKKIKEGIILVGNESRGISAEILNLATTRITIPAKGRAESLNAAVAAGIILSHLC